MAETPIKQFDDDIVDIKKQSLYARLKRLFSTDVIVRNIGGKQIKIKDTDSIMYATDRNSLRDRFNRIRATSYNAYSRDFALSYQAARMDLFRDYDTMDLDPILSCLAPTTYISTLEGFITIEDLAKKYPNGESFKVWSWDNEKHKLTIGNAHHPRKTGTKKVIEIHLDNNEVLKCTADHRLMLIDGTYKEAGKLSCGESLMPFYHRINKYSGYQEIKTLGSKFKPIHRYISEDVFEGKIGKNEKIDFNYILKLSQIFPEYFNFLWKIPIWKEWKRKKHLKTLSLKIVNDKYKKEITTEKILIEGLKFDSLNEFVKNVDLGDSFPQNIDRKCQFIRRRLHRAGFKNWKDYKENFEYSNHVVAKIIDNNEEMDVYDLTVDFFENFAIKQGIIVSNSALDIYAEESLTLNELKQMMVIHSKNSNIKSILHNLFYDVLNIEGNLWSWTRNMCKYGDFYLKLYITPEYGIYMVEPISAYNVERIENCDPYNKRYVKFQIRPTDTSQAEVCENYEMAHFRLLSDSNFLPYGKCLTANNYIETEFGCKRINEIKIGDKVWSFNLVNRKFELTTVKNTCKSGKKPILKISTKHNQIECSLEHPILVFIPGLNVFEYKQAKDITIDNIIATSLNNKEISTSNIDRIQRFEEEEETFDIQVESENSNFIANGIIVHNSMIEGARRVWKQLCLSEDTEIWTSDGIKLIKDIKAGDIVYSFDYNNNKIIETVVKNSLMTGIRPVYEIKTKHRKIYATEEHPFMVKNGEYKQVKDLTINDYLILPNLNQNETIEYPKLIVEETEDWKYDSKLHIIDESILKNNFKMLVRFFGFMLGDGWIDNSNSCIAFSVGDRLDKSQKYIEFIKTLGINYGLTNELNPNSSCVVYSTYLYKLFKQLEFITGTKNKIVPSWVWNLPVEYKKELIFGFSDADGCDRDENTFQLGSINSNLIENLRHLAMQCGMSVTKIWKTSEKSYWSDKLCNMTCFTYKLNSRDFIPVNDSYHIEKIKSISKSHTSDVYDIEVESDLHNFIANGLVSHNCLLEDAMLIHRIMRAPERRIFKVDVGTIPPNEVDTYMEKLISKVKKVPYMDEQTGEYNLRFNLQPVRHDTKIPLLDGRTITIKQLSEETNQGKQNYVYSIDRNNNNKLSFGLVSWCGLTKENADLVRIILNDNSYIDFEPNHPVMLRDGSYISAKDLKEKDSLMPFYTSKSKDNCEMVYDPSINQYKSTQQLIQEGFNIVGSVEFKNNTTFNGHRNKIYKFLNNGKKLKNMINHTVKAVIILNEKDDVYCMNVEKYHNFAIDSNGGLNRDGIFVKNSMVEDFYLPVRGGDSGTEIDTLSGMEWTGIEDLDYVKNKMMAALKIPKAFLGFDEALSGKSTLACVVPETQVPLLNGITKTVKELIDDHNNGIKNYVYSIDEETKNIVPGEIEWAGFTRMNTDVIKVHLDNNNYIDCTPDHRFMTRDGNWIEAKDLNIGDSLMPFYKEKLITELKYIKVVNIERLVEKRDTCDITIKKYHNFATSAGVIIHNSEDVRFARTIQRIQRILVSELSKIAIVHLYAQGYRDESLVDFELELTNPSTIFEKEKVEIWSDKISVASDMTELKLFSRDWIYKNVFNLSDEDKMKIEDQVLEDTKQTFRLTSIEEEGNDPAKPIQKINPEDIGGGGGEMGGEGGGEGEEMGNEGPMGEEPKGPEGGGGEIPGLVKERLKPDKDKDRDQTGRKDSNDYPYGEDPLGKLGMESKPTADRDINPNPRKVRFGLHEHIKLKPGIESEVINNLQAFLSKSLEQEKAELLNEGGNKDKNATFLDEKNIIDE